MALNSPPLLLSLVVCVTASYSVVYFIIFCACVCVIHLSELFFYFLYRLLTPGVSV